MSSVKNNWVCSLLENEYIIIKKYGPSQTSFRRIVSQRSLRTQLNVRQINTEIKLNG